MRKALSKISNIQHIVENLEKYDKFGAIYAVEPWTSNSEALVATEPEEGGLPSKALELGMAYFIEVFISIDFLEDWIVDLKSKPTSKEKCDRLIGYVINDA